MKRSDRRWVVYGVAGLLVIVVCYILAPLRMRADELLGTKTIAKLQNKDADDDDLTRFETYSQVVRFRKHNLLVSLPENEGVRIDKRLEEPWRFCRPWTARFLSDLGALYFAEFHESLQVNSAVRTVDRQKRLQKVNGNAAPTSGDRRSSHLTGATVDIAAKGLSGEERQWVEHTLALLMQRGLLVAVKERKNQLCFHVMVRRVYDEHRLVFTSTIQGGGQ